MSGYEVRPHTIDGQLTAVVEATLPVPEIGPWLARTFGMIAEVLAARGVPPAGPPFARYHRIDAGERFSVQAGFPVADLIERMGEVRPSSLPGGPAAMTVHIGPYEQMEPAYAALAAWIGGHDGEPVGDPWEIYLSDPARQPDPATWRTEIVQPYRTA